MKLQPESAIITIYITTVAMLVLISCDKSLHTYFECLLYHTLKNPLPEDVLHEIIRGAVDVERTFICEALSCDLIGMNPSTASGEAKGAVASTASSEDRYAHAPWRTQMPRKLTAAEIAVQQHVDEDLLKKHNAAAKLYGNLGHLSRSQEGV